MFAVVWCVFECEHFTWMAWLTRGLDDAAAPPAAVLDIGALALPKPRSGVIGAASCSAGLPLPCHLAGVVAALAVAVRLHVV